MIRCDSRKVKQGDTFIAIRGINNDGHDFIDEAIDNGATRVICEGGDYSVDTLIVSDTRVYLHDLLKDKFSFLINDLKIIGVTGTNGKTTTCYLLYQALNMLNLKCAYIGTLGFYTLESQKKLDNTTPDILDLYEMLLYCKENNYKFVAMEVSSQGLAYNRLDGILFDYAIFTNLTIDHLDFHKTMENYAFEKKKLFSKLKDNGVSIINNDDDYKDYFISDESITYGFSESSYKISDYNSSLNGMNFKVNDIDFNSSLIGVYNVYNITIVIIILKLLKFSDDDIRMVVSNLKNACGRMDFIKYNDNLIIVDYAHTPDAVLKVIKCVKKLGNRVITIIGCGGNRDKSKRPIMGRIATLESFYVIFTSDNPRWEDPKDILNDITGLLDNNNYEIEVNREKAIKRGIQILDKNDILLILGKGHEDYQIINGEKFHFNDMEIVLKNI